MPNKSILTVMLMLSIVSIGQAQLQPQSKLPHSLFPKKENPYFKPLPKTYTPQLLNKNIVIPKTIQAPAPGVVVLANPMNYSHNNGRGFDVYKSNIDGMPVLMPDKNNRESLGIVGKNTSDPKTSDLPEKMLQYNGPQFLK